jgi:ElaB/YqjD/DUF883 family membrane-anchored ribosome-binding protein
MVRNSDGGKAGRSTSGGVGELLFGARRSTRALLGCLDALILHYPSGAVNYPRLTILDALKFVSLFGAGGARFDVPGVVMLEMSMSKNSEGDVAADLAAIREDVARLAETIGKLLQRETQAAGVGVSDAVGDAKDKVADTAAGARDFTRAASGEIEASIERNPLTAVLIAFGVGMWLGLMSRSRG